jgi:putative sterol carrier protein
MAIRSLFEPGAASGLREAYELRIDGEAFQLRVDGGSVEVRQGCADAPDVVVSGGADTFLALSAGRLAPGEALESGELRIEGDGDALDRCLRVLGSATTTV